MQKVLISASRLRFSSSAAAELVRCGSFGWLDGLFVGLLDGLFDGLAAGVAAVCCCVVACGVALGWVTGEGPAAPVVLCGTVTVIPGICNGCAGGS